MQTRLKLYVTHRHLWNSKCASFQTKRTVELKVFNRYKFGTLMPDENKNFCGALVLDLLTSRENDLYLKCAAKNVSCNTGAVWHSVRRPVIINKRESLDIQRFTLVRQLFRVACRSMSVESPVFSRYRPVYIQAGSSICYTTTERVV